jgi:hypothetical protein
MCREVSRATHLGLRRGALRFVLLLVPALISIALLCAAQSTAEARRSSSLNGESTATTISPSGSPLLIHEPSSADPNADETAIAFDGTNFFTVEVSDSIPYATRVTTTGQVLDPAGIQLGSSASATPNVVFDGTNYFVVWVSGSDIRAVRVRPDGAVLDSPELTIVTGAKPRMVGVAFDGTNYLVVWRTLSDAIHGARISMTGQNLDDPIGLDGFLISGAGFYPLVTYANGQYFVVWYYWGNGLDIFGARVSPDGSVMAPGVFSISSADGDQNHPSVASSGTEYLVAWNDSRGASYYNDGSARAARVSAGGVVLDDPAIVVGDYERGGATTVFDGTDYLIVWQADETPQNFRIVDAFGRRISLDGEIVDSQPIPLGTAHGHQWGPTIGVGGERYLVAWNESLSSTRCSGGSCRYGQLFEKSASGLAPPTGSGVSPIYAGWSAITNPISPLGDAINDIWAFDETHVYAISNNGTVIKYDGIAWGTGWAPYFSSHARFGIWGTGPSDVWAVGWCGDIVRYDGESWDETGCAPNRMTTGVWSSDPIHILTVGVAGQFVRYEGTDLSTCCGLDMGNWRERPTGVDVDLWDIWGSEAENVYAVGEFGTIIHYNGSTWASVTGVPSGQSLNAIWGTGPDDIFVVGDAGTILHYDGESWTHQASGASENLTGVSGSSGYNVYAVGFGGTILYYDGESWKPEVSGTNQALLDVVVAGDNVWAVGDAGVILKKVANVTPFGTEITSGPSGATNDNTPIFEFSASEPDSTFQCSLDGSLFTVCDSPTVLGSLADGVHSFAVKATDPLGNTDETSAVSSFTVDTVAPETTISSGPSDTTNDNTPTFVYSASEPGSTFECSLDGGTFTACNSPYTTTLEDGGHYFQVKATDPAGNTDQAPAVRSFTVDTVAPETTITSGPSGATSNNTPSVEFSASEPGSTFECSLDSGDYSPGCVSPTPLEFYAGGPLVDGAHSFAVKATDAVGNTDETPAVRSFTVDTVAPETIITSGPTGVTNDNTPTFEFSASDPGSSFKCALDAVPATACNSPYTTPVLANGDHDLSVGAIDPAGNLDQTPAARSFTVDTTAAPPATDGSAGTKKGKIVSAKLSKKSFSSSEAREVKLTCTFSPKSKLFAYVLSLKKGAKWAVVKSARKTGSFTKYTRTVKQLFAGKPVKRGTYRLKLSADKNSKTLSFKVT